MPKLQLRQTKFTPIRVTALMKIPLAVVLSLGISGSNAAADETANETDDANFTTLNLQITDSSEVSIEDATARIFQWTGEYQATGVSGQSDSAGVVELTRIPVDEYLYVVINKAGYVPGVITLTFSKPSSREIKIRLSQPIETWLEVIDPGGNPVVGAEFQSLDFADLDGNRVYVNLVSASAFGFDLQPSDQNGRLKLPAIPDGVSLTASVIHPEWAAVKMTDLVVTEGLLTTTALTQGTPITVEINSTGDGAEIPDGTPVSVAMVPQTGGSRQVSSIRHHFLVQDGKIRFTASDTEYQELRLEAKDFHISPRLNDHELGSTADLDCRDRNAKTFHQKAHPVVTLRGRVLHSKGRPAKDAFVSATIYPTELADQLESLRQRDDAESKATIANAQIASVFDTTDSDGKYTLKAAAGVAHLGVLSTGNFVKHDSDLVPIKPDTDNMAPDITLLPIPAIGGVVKDPDGNAITGAIVWLRTHGYSDAMPFATTNSKGTFRLNLERIPLDKTGSGPWRQIFAIACKPGTNLADIVEIDLSDRESAKIVSLHLQPRESDWLLNPPPFEQAKPADTPATLDEAAKLAQAWIKIRETYPDGIPGNDVPNLVEGKWLNSDAVSLEDFRGRFVLLDFWFIGCGPCHREEPALKMIHETFPPDKFALVSVHNNSQTVDNVVEFLTDNAMRFPTVVDNPDSEIGDQYRKYGIYFYPGYILIDPNGKIVRNDGVPDSTNTLRSRKIELIQTAIQDWDWTETTSTQ